MSSFVFWMAVSFVVGAAFGCGVTLWGKAGSESFVDRDDS
jgi:hypothetical protein